MVADNTVVCFGYATDECESEALCSASYLYAHKLCETIAEMRKSGAMSWLLPDCSASVAVEYEVLEHENNKLKVNRITHVIVETQIAPTITEEDVKK